MEKGRNIQIEYHWYMGDVEKARASAAELVRLAPDVLANGAAGLEIATGDAHNTNRVHVYRGASRQGCSFRDLAHPGGNIMGSQILGDDTAKWIELIKEIAPSVKRVAIHLQSSNIALFFLQYSLRVRRKLLPKHLHWSRCQLWFIRLRK